jgi:membrane-associated HD superfamily phosphohydrolase
VQTAALVVFCVFAMISVIFLYTFSWMHGDLLYDNAGQPLRFWITFLVGLILSQVCIFMPVGGWPYLVIFVALALFSNQALGTLAGSVLLLFTCVHTSVDLAAFFLHFLSGLFICALFARLDRHFRLALPLLLSQMILLINQMIYLTMSGQQGFHWERFVIPIANSIVSSTLLFVLFRWFFSHIIWKDRLRYLEILNPEGRFLQEFKEKARKDFYHCMHTAHFCERIAQELKLDVDALKTAGYYQKIGVILPSQMSVKEQAKDPPEEKEVADETVLPMWKRVDTYLSENCFPTPCRRILREYLEEGAPIHSTEATILIFVDAVLSSVSYLHAKNQTVVADFDKLVDSVYRKGQESGLLAESQITMAQLTMMKRIFKEEKLYYDFLR